MNLRKGDQRYKVILGEVRIKDLNFVRICRRNNSLFSIIDGDDLLERRKV